MTLPPRLRWPRTATLRRQRRPWQRQRRRLFTEKKPYVTFGGANNGCALTSAYVAGPIIAEYAGAAKQMIR